MPCIWTMKAGEHTCRGVARPGAGPGRRGRSGQTLIFMIMLLVALVFVVLWTFDVHKILFIKGRTQNAGDAAAMAAARWQAITLNLIGDLNVAQAVAITEALEKADALRQDPDFLAARAIAGLQARLCFVGPMVGLIACQQAAKNNGMFNNSEFDGLLGEHIKEIRDHYKDNYVAPYEGCWEEYADMLQVVLDMGVVAGPDNTRRYTDYRHYNHTLLDQNFYDAIANRNWCWFYFNEMDLLKTYTSYRDWDPLPRITHRRPENSEIFGLELHTVSRLEYLPLYYSWVDTNDVEELEAELVVRAGQKMHERLAKTGADWYCYQPYRWRTWEEHLPTNFPFCGTIKQKYDYSGADAAVRIAASSRGSAPQGMVARMSEKDYDPKGPAPTGPKQEILWTAAAKPFGSLTGGERPTRYGLVLPAFEHVRLIPVDASSAPFANHYDASWRPHIDDHLPRYVKHGTGELSMTCWYCQQLDLWEQSAFRRAGLTWLRKFKNTCHIGTRGDGSDGGTRRGH